MYFRLLSTIVVVFSVYGCTATAPVRPQTPVQGSYQYTREYVSWLIEELIQEHDVPGLSIALVDDQKLVWAQGFGYADKEAKVTATPETIYRVGSIAKLFTASATMQLAERNRLDIDGPLSHALPDFSIKSRYRDTAPITPRSIMTHHSGLPADILRGMWTRDSEPRFTEVAAQLKDEYAAYPPNFIYSYSNVALSLLGHAIQHQAGQPFHQYMQDNLMQPLDMRHSSFRAEGLPGTLLAKGYSNGDPIDPGQLRDIPAGGLYSNVRDLGQYLKMIFADGRGADGSQVLTPASVAEMLRIQNSDVALDFNFDIGLGWFLVRHGIQGVKTVASHGGGTPCFFSQMIALPEVKLGVVVLANSCSAGSVVADTAAATLKLALEAKTGFRQPLEHKMVKAAVDEHPSDERLDGFVGRYATWLGLIEVHRKRERLKARISGWDFELIPLADGRYGLEFKLFGLISIRHLYGIDLDNVLLTPVKIDDRQVVVMTFKGRDQVFGEKVQPVPLHPVWQARLGELEVLGQDPTMQFRDTRLVDDNGILLMTYRLKMPVLPEQRAALPIRPISDKEAIILGLGRGMGETVRIVEKDGQEVLYFSGYDAVWRHYDDPEAFRVTLGKPLPPSVVGSQQPVLDPTRSGSSE